MDSAKLESIFSTVRLSRYLNACGGNIEKGLELYKYNIQASQALYPLISVLEIALRNRIDRELAKHYKDQDWLLTQQADFADNPQLLYKDDFGVVRRDHFFRSKIDKAERKLTFRGSAITHVKLLAELTFGFWVKFYDTGPIKILRGAPLQAFTNKPGVKLARVHSHLNSIVTLRNRISHNEPICFDKHGKLCLDTLRQYIFDIEDALRWIDADLKEWSDKLNFYKPVVMRISKL